VKGSDAAERRFRRLADTVRAEPGVTLPDEAAGARRFGSDALKVDGRIFAMISDGGLVVKLPSTRVAELIASGEGAPFDAGKGRPMKEWLVVVPAADDDRWRELASEALRFVRAGRPAR
jgi:hypothetical protein